MKKTDGKPKRIERWLSACLNFNIFGWLLRLLGNLSRPKRLIQIAVLAGLAVGTYRADQLGARQVAGNMVLAVIAHQKAGDPLPFGPDYTLSMPYPSRATYGIEVNSMWLLKNITYAVPFFAYEKVSGLPTYPEAAFFFPRTGLGSFTVGGQMNPMGGVGDGGWLTLNERYLTDPQWIDEAATLATLVHELVHVQGGNYLSQDADVELSTAAESAFIESNTSAATLEVLAGMCNFRNELACAAFWQDIESFALASINTRLEEGPYDLFRSVFLLDAEEEMADRKTDRFWAEYQEKRQEIREKYGRHPWESHVVEGLRGKALDTRLLYQPDMMGPVYKLRMPFDDTFDMLGWRLNVLIWLTYLGR